jgi:hypothetical protein
LDRESVGEESDQRKESKYEKKLDMLAPSFVERPPEGEERKEHDNFIEIGHPTYWHLFTF